MNEESNVETNKSQNAFQRGSNMSKNRGADRWNMKLAVQRQKRNQLKNAKQFDKIQIFEEFIQFANKNNLTDGGFQLGCGLSSQYIYLTRKQS